MHREITPVFIMGAPRSGTTFLASTIASHKDVVALPEMHYAYKLMEQELVYGHVSLVKALGILKNDFHFCSMQLFDRLKDLEDFLRGKCAKDIILKTVGLYNEKYFKKNYRYWVEHSPNSHKHLDLIQKLFPGAIFVHSLRDPRAVIASTITEPWGFKDVVTGAETWNQNVTDVMKQESIYNIHMVKYETLVLDLETSLRKLCEVIGMKYSHEMMNNNGILSKSYFENKRPFIGVGVDANRNEKWKRSLSTKQVAHINFVNKDLMSKFGYLTEVDQVKSLNRFEVIVYRTIGRLKSMYFNKKFKREMRKVFCRLS